MGGVCDLCIDCSGSKCKLAANPPNQQNLLAVEVLSECHLPTKKKRRRDKKKKLEIESPCDILREIRTSRKDEPFSPKGLYITREQMVPEGDRVYGVSTCSIRELEGKKGMAIAESSVLENEIFNSSGDPAECIGIHSGDICWLRDNGGNTLAGYNQTMYITERLMVPEEDPVYEAPTISMMNLEGKQVTWITESSVLVHEKTSSVGVTGKCYGIQTGDIMWVRGDEENTATDYNTEMYIAGEQTISVEDRVYEVTDSPDKEPSTASDSGSSGTYSTGSTFTEQVSLSDNIWGATRALFDEDDSQPEMPPILRKGSCVADQFDKCFEEGECIGIQSYSLCWLRGDEGNAPNDYQDTMFMVKEVMASKAERSNEGGEVVTKLRKRKLSRRTLLKKRELITAYVNHVPSMRRKPTMVSIACNRLWKEVTNTKKGKVKVTEHLYKRELAWLQARALKSLSLNVNESLSILRAETDRATKCVHKIAGVDDESMNF